MFLISTPLVALSALAFPLYINAFVCNLNMVSNAVRLDGGSHRRIDEVDREVAKLKEKSVGSAPWIADQFAQNNIIKLKREKAAKGITGGTSPRDPEVIPWQPRARIQLNDVTKLTPKKIFGLETGAAITELDHVNLDICSAGATMVVLEDRNDGAEMFLKCVTGSAKPSSGDIRISGLENRQVLLINGRHDYNEKKRADENVQAVLDRIGGIGGRLPQTCRRILALVELEPRVYTERACDLSGTDALKFELAMKLAEAAAKPLPPLVVVQPQDSFLDLHFMDRRVYGKFFGLLHRLSRDKGIKVLYAVDDGYFAYLPADDVIVFHNGKVVEHKPVEQSWTVQRRRDEESEERMKAMLGDFWKPTHTYRTQNAV